MDNSVKPSCNMLLPTGMVHFNELPSSPIDKLSKWIDSTKSLHRALHVTLVSLAHTSPDRLDAVKKLASDTAKGSLKAVPLLLLRPAPFCPRA
eukprot:468417-Amphidinium_carterae.1